MKKENQKVRLATFIETHQKEILIEWDSFAKTLFSGIDKFHISLLRDHAREILIELVSEMEQKESPQQQKAKSLGAPSPAHPAESAANGHGLLRYHDGLSFTSLAAEFRALRASVLRLWLPNIPVITKQVLLDVVRFNEAIDEALADSIATYETR